MKNEYVPTVHRGRGNMEAWKGMLPVLEGFSKTIGRDVHVSNPHQQTSDPNQDKDVFHIRFWSAATGGHGWERGPGVKEFYGHKATGCQGMCSLPSGLLPTIKDPAGTAVAEIAEHTLYILFDLPHGSQERAALILEKILADTLAKMDTKEYKKAVKQFEKAVKDKQKEEAAAKEKLEKEKAAAKKKKEKEEALKMAKAAEEIKKELKEKAVGSEERYVKLCSKRNTQEIKDLKTGLEANEKKLSELQEEIFKITRSQVKSRKMLRFFEEDDKENPEYILEFEKIKEMEDVKEVFVDGSVIRVFTENIYIEHKGKTYDIGELELYIDASGGQIKILNHTRTVPEAGWRSNYSHPHATQCGIVCWGNVHGSIPKLMGEGQYAVVVQVLLQWLKGYDPGHMGNIEKWPEVTQIKETIKC